MRRIFGALIGAIPGTILLILSGPVQGEVELTLAMAGILLIIAGVVIGAVLSKKPADK